MVKAGKALEHAIKISDMDQRITIKEVTTTQTTTGHEEITYQTLYTRWAHRIDGVPRESEEAYQERSQQYVVWVIRYISNISADMTVTDSAGRVYNIEGTQTIGRKRFLRINTHVAE